MIFQNPYKFFQFFFMFFRILSLKWRGYDCATVKLIGEKILCVIWNLGTKKYPKFVTFRSFFNIFKKNFNKVKKMKFE